MASMPLFDCGIWFPSPLCMLELEVLLPTLIVEFDFHYRFVYWNSVLLLPAWIMNQYSYWFILWISCFITVMMLVHILSLLKEGIKQYVSKVMVYLYYWDDEGIKQFVAEILSTYFLLGCWTSAYHMSSLFMETS